MAWLRREEYVRGAVSAAAQRAYEDGYYLGKAHGELLGRQELATELQKAYGVGGGERAMEPGALEDLRVRQLH